MGLAGGDVLEVIFYAFSENRCDDVCMRWVCSTSRKFLISLDAIPVVLSLRILPGLWNRDVATTNIDNESKSWSIGFRPQIPEQISNFASILISVHIVDFADRVEGNVPFEGIDILDLKGIKEGARLR